jgi:hypothetical protein
LNLEFAQTHVASIVLRHVPDLPYLDAALCKTMLAPCGEVINYLTPQMQQKFQIEPARLTSIERS